MPRWRAFLAPFASDAEALAWLRRFYPRIANGQVAGGLVLFTLGRGGPAASAPLRPFVARLRAIRASRGRSV